VQVEFNGTRGKSYKHAIELYSNVWNQDLQIMYQYLRPQPGEKIVEIGAGSGFYSTKISKEIGCNGVLYVVEPSLEQLLPVIRNKQLTNISYYCQPAEDFVLNEDDVVDKIWTRGAFHHVKNKELVFRNLSKYSTANTELYLFDIFSGTSVSTFFDTFVAKACITGHEVNFLSKEYATSLCFVTGWGAPEFHDIFLQWEFETEYDIGKFLSMMLFIKPEYSYMDVQMIAKEILGYEYKNGKFYLNWPMTIMKTKKDY